MNDLQRAIATDYLEMLKSGKDRWKVLGCLAAKHHIGRWEAEGVLHLAIQEGLMHPYLEGSVKSRNRLHPLNPMEMIVDHEKRLAHFEDKLQWLAEGIQRVLEDSETFAVHLQNIHKMAGLVKGRDDRVRPKRDKPLRFLLEHKRAV